MTAQHLDDEALSAALDGAASGDEEAHLATCPTCQAQLASRAAVARAVGAPVAPRPAAEIDVAIAQALMAWTPATSPGDIGDDGHRGADRPGGADRPAWWGIAEMVGDRGWNRGRR